MIERVRAKPASSYQPRKGDLVQVTYISLPEKAVAKVLEVGPEQTRIKWVHNGNEVYVENKDLKKADDANTVNRNSPRGR